MHVRLDIAILLGMAGVTLGFFAIGCCPPPPLCKDLTLQEIEALPEDERKAAFECLTECDPHKSSEPVGKFCGVFVSSTKGNDENEGTKEKPFRTVKKALEILPTKPSPKEGAKASIYLCAEQFEEEVTLASGTPIFGGLDCNAPAPNTWKYRVPHVKTVLMAPEGKPPLRLGPGKGTTEVHDLRVVAMSAPETMPGGSSIAVIVNETAARFERSEIEAGDGANGMDGEPYYEAATEGAPGAPGNVACAMVPHATEGPENKCGTASSLGGSGGPGGTHSGSTGGPGEPYIKANGGSGETSDVSSVSVCSDGEPGAEGTLGGAGDDATGLGTLDPYVGHTGVRGTDGKPGTPGQGGGGGGGAKSKVGNVNQCSGGMGYGASGGSGGAGGCGGAGGKGGDTGGSSIAVVSIESKLSFSATTIKVGSGGAPGNGGPGQEGGAGGVGAEGGKVPMGVNLNPACAGGTGGKGGSGGSGGKGLGGHMIGIAYRGQEPEFVDISIFVQQSTKVTGGIKAETQLFPE